MHNLTKSVRCVRGATVTAGAAGTSTINGALLDMANFDSVLAIVPLGPIVSTGAVVVKWQGGGLADGSDMADLAGTGQSFGDTDDDTLVLAEVTPRPEHRFVRIVVTRSTANSTVGGIQYLQRGARRIPVTHGAGVACELIVDPAEGAA